MKKAIFIVMGIFFAFSFVFTAFAGGFIVGRVTGAHSAPGDIPMPTHEFLEPEQGETPSSEEQETPTTDEMRRFDYKILEEVLNLLRRDFYGEIPDGKALAYGAIRGMLFTLEDPYTSFIDPQVADILNEDASGQFEGIGATVRMRTDGYLEIVRPLPGHPAEEVGLQAEDLVLTVDEQSIIGMGLYEAIGLIRGPAGTEVTLEIARPGESETFFVTIIRAAIEVPVVEHEILEEDIAYIHLTEFDANAQSSIEEVLREMLVENPQGLILDLRDNPGGWLDQAIKVSDIFLDEGLIAIERDSSGNEERFNAFDGDIGEDIPMVVLVNGGSASASEIVAGAVQDRDRAILIGETTLGKGSVQRPHNLSDGSQLRVTIALWFTPDDHSIHGEGLTPDIEVPRPPDTPVSEDPQLDRAVEYLLENE